MLATVPPTTHCLPKPQRLRLMRSTRKLSALLGTTPLLLDERETVTSPLRSQTFASADKRASTAGSVLSFDSDFAERDPAALLPAATSPTSAHRPTLLLRINTIPARTRGRANSQAWGRPMSFALPESPTSPPPEEDATMSGDTLDEALAARRRKMARLTRTLGENVPPELVFRPIAPPSRSDASSSDGSDDDDEDLEKLTPLEEWAGLGTKVAVVPPPSAFPVDSPRTSAESRRPSVASDRVAAPVAWFPNNMRRSASVIDCKATRRTRGKSMSASVMKRQETGWTGEWNQEEKDVLKALRELKHK
ncbi:hypothetical protein C8R43DRAFT_1128598 [Mycena crocata]|nr:hypothetical protein C8R43DRAFT_1128598 [Mycena crocata]